MSRSRCPRATAAVCKDGRVVISHAHAQTGRSQAAVVARRHYDHQSRQREVVQRGVERRLRPLRRPRGAGAEGSAGCRRVR